MSWEQGGAKGWEKTQQVQMTRTDQRNISHHTMSPLSIKVKKEEAGKGKCLPNWKLLGQRLDANLFMRGNE